MIGVMLETVGGLGGISFSNLLNQLGQFGFFSYVLPLMLVFAAVYAILTQIKIFSDNKGAAMIVALAIGFLSLVGGWVPTFFMTIFSNFGVGLSILLVAMILAGAFLTSNDPKDNAFKWIFFGIGAFIFVVVTFVSLNEWQNFSYGGWWWHEWGGLIIFLIVLAGVVVAVSLAGKKKAA